MLVPEEHTDTLVDRTVTYALMKDDRLYIVEHVPARVSVETGEEFFAAETVDRLQQTIWSQRTPVRILEAPVFEYSAG